MDKNGYKKFDLNSFDIFGYKYILVIVLQLFGIVILYDIT